ncbi:MAG TPA: hypothetical protein VKD69_20945, partial [Vicinamibacterales bacterium]|nr:hypothetical protein [Vicinamibacterales bacterium]
MSAALELDPNFLAAHSLRDRIVSGELPVREAAAAPSAAAADTALPADVKPASLDEGYAQFEQRAKRRRVDRRVEAARLALEKKHLRHAAAALDEVIELDPNLPELTDLTVRFDQLRRSSAGSHRGPWLVAAGVFAASVLGATWLQESSALLSRSMIAPAPLLAAPTPSAISFDVDAVATTGEREPAEAAELSVVPR